MRKCYSRSKVSEKRNSNQHEISNAAEQIAKKQNSQLDMWPRIGEGAPDEVEEAVPADLQNFSSR